MKISVIMPVYNGQDFLEDSINSVLNQTFKDFELICVNDSSKDNSLDILENFAKKDSRVRPLTKENGGPASALNYGIEHSQGEYLCFIDQDDLYNNDYLERMFNLIEQTKLSVCYCGADFFYEDNSHKKIPYPSLKEPVTKINFLNEKNLYVYRAPQWTKIIRKQFLIDNKIKFLTRENKAHDLSFNLMVLFFSKKVGIINESLYNHRYHSGQISYNMDFAKACLDTYKELNSYGKTNFKFFDYLRFKQFLKRLIRKAYRSTCDESLITEIINISKENYKGLNGIILKRKEKKRKEKILILNVPAIENVGKNTYYSSNLTIVSPDTKIGAFCSIGDNVVLGHGEHPLNFLSTSPYFYYDNLGWKTDETVSHNEFWNYKPIEIGNDVWIGNNVFVKNGIKIGDGAVIGANALVTKDVPPYAIVAGNPAKILKYRFDEETIQKLLDFSWWNYDDEVLKTIPYDNLDACIEYFKNNK